MLSIAKINSAANQATKGQGSKGYLHYLGGPTDTTRQSGDFDDYAREKGSMSGPPPFWACKGAALLGLDGIAEAEQVARLAKGFHPVSGAPLVKGAGDGHVMGLDMTFSAPKDVSAVFAGGDAKTRAEVSDCVREAARAALSYAESGAVTRHGHGGKHRQLAEAAVAACYSHFASRAGEPQLHVHGFLFNVGRRRGAPEWSALEHRAQFERKLATGILFRVELASLMRGLGFAVEPAGPYFTIRGVSAQQRDALSSRSKLIAEYLRDQGMPESDAAARAVAAMNTRAAKAEPSLPELLESFERMAAELGLTPNAISAMRKGPTPSAPAEPFSINRQEVLDALMEKQSCATAQEALTMICERAMGQWSAAECLAELDQFLAHAHVVPLGRGELLAEIFTSKSTLDMEAAISEAVAAGSKDRGHRVDRELVDREFDRLERTLREKLGVPASLGQQRAAAMHVAAETGRHSFVEGWAGAGKTTMLGALAAAYKAGGFDVHGCCQSAAASQNLARETGIPSRTIASLLLALQKGRARLGPKSILVLDEAGMVGSREFSLLQEEAGRAGAKLVCVGDSKQLQPIDAGGIFRALVERHGKAEISSIQRQRTDFEPLLRWLSKQGILTGPKTEALRQAPEEARHQALEALCSADPKLRQAFDRWQARYDHEWMRQAVELFATGEARKALDLLDARGRLRLLPGHTAAIDALVADWSADLTPLHQKTMVAGTRQEVAELNAKARAALIGKGLVDDAAGIEVEIVHRDESTDLRRFAAGDRIVFTKNDKPIGVANGAAGKVLAIEQAMFEALLVVELDDENERGERIVRAPTSFGRFDHAFCLTNHKSQGRTFDAAYVMANPAMADREWTYVAASRSRFATTVYANLAALGAVDIESHAAADDKPQTREAVIDALASRMRRSRAKGTSLDYQEAPRIQTLAEAEVGAATTTATANRVATATGAPIGQQWRIGHRAQEVIKQFRTFAAMAAEAAARQFKRKDFASVEEKMDAPNAMEPTALRQLIAEAEPTPAAGRWIAESLAGLERRQ